MSFSTNPELELAYEFIQNTNRNIFLTGKAGTGKTTFLHRIKEESVKRLAVVAPTGVAAINARGQTIHSLFQLPFSPFIPGAKPDASRQRQFSGKKISLLRSLDLLIIDEISMVRCDTLDAIDEVLRRYRDPLKPFGGVQLLMIGDLHQLPPVVRDDTWNMLRAHYRTPYFFGSLSLQNTHPVVIQLTKIYRQADDVFINLLNKVRDNVMTPEVLELLNSRYIPNFKAPEDEPYITLTSHNRAADTINEKKLTELTAPLYQFKAIVKDEFPEKIYPTPLVTEFKKGAQVMFIKNDISEFKRWYNGKIGTVTGFGKDFIYVRCPDESEDFSVPKVVWENVKYDLNEKTKEVTDNVVGTFEQYPLRLAWAITIHKSQGLTFERAVIDAAAAFAHGQVYVALSRCTSFEGIVLHSRIQTRSVRTDSVVQNYSARAEENPPTAEELENSKRKYQEEVIAELFDMKAVRKALAAADRAVFPNENTLSGNTVELYKAWSIQAEAKVLAIAEKFMPQLRGYFLHPDLPEENQKLQDRLKKAADYFIGQFKDSLLPALKNMPIATDNASVKKSVKEKLRDLEKEVFVKNACFKVAQNGFRATAYLKAKSDAALDFAKIYKARKEVKVTPADSPHPDLHRRLNDWRDEKAHDLGIALASVLPLKTISEISHYLPLTPARLQAIKGIGKVKVGKFGHEIIEIVEKYCQEKGVEGNLTNVKLSEKLDKDTRVVSLEIFRREKDIDKTAAARGLKRSTIEGHLANWVESGEVDLFDTMERGRAEEMLAFFAKNAESTSREAKDFFGEKYSYGDLKLVRAHLKGAEKT